MLVIDHENYFVLSKFRTCRKYLTQCKHRRGNYLRASLDRLVPCTKQTSVMERAHLLFVLLLVVSAEFQVKCVQAKEGKPMN